MKRLSSSLYAAAAILVAAGTVAQPVDEIVPRHARQQPSVPDNYAELPFSEVAPTPVLTPQEQTRGFLLFQRPITEPVHPNTRPLAHERLRELTAFATPGEFEPLTFSIYPVRDLQKMKVRVSPLRSGDDVIAAENLTVRLATYWNMGYPRYTSRDTYRRLAELLEEVTEHSSPRHECQRWWITVHVPEGAAPGLYEGTVTLWDEGLQHEDGSGHSAIQITLTLRVLDFRLQSDPAKSYSVYTYLGNSVQYGDRPEEFKREAMGNEYRAMAELGIDTYPTLSLSYDAVADTMILRYADELPRMHAAGLRGPVPVGGGNAIDVIYKRMTPGGERAAHWRIDKMPPPAFYKEVTRAFSALKQQAQAEGWPELIICPLDEVDASRSDFGAGVYRAVRDAGFRTYITKNPLASDATPYHEGVDIWCSQPFSTPYESIVGQDRFEYWSYPNHNAGEIKDRRVMQKGGRMSYGYGLWRSGYTTLIPWHWAWTPAPDQFDYLRGRRSGTGQRIGDDGEVIEAVYWQSFREGRDDARYIYTLQQAIWERQGSSDEACLQLVREGKQALQELWSAIQVQEKYLADGMWPSTEFNARRWRLAMLTQRLLEHPSLRQTPAPSVLVDDTLPVAARSDMEMINDAIEAGEVATRDLGGDFTQWENITGEGTLAVTTEAGRNGKPGLRWQVEVDHSTDGGGEESDYPIGWPRIHRIFSPGELDMADSDYLLYQIRIDSDRDEVADDTTPVGFTIGSNQFWEEGRDLGARQRQWLPVLFPIRSLIEGVGQGEDPWRSIEKVQFFLSEGQYADGTRLTFDVAEVSLLRFISPLLARLEVPHFVTTPTPELQVGFRVMGTRSVHAGSHVVVAQLVDATGRVHLSDRQDLATHEYLLLDTSRVAPGVFTIQVQILTAAGELCSQMDQLVEVIAGPVAIRGGRVPATHDR
jgi:hypothetical protein